MNVRQAVAWAIDREKINEISMGGLSTTGAAMFGPAQPYWQWTPPAGEAYTYDPEKASRSSTPPATSTVTVTMCAKRRAASRSPSAWSL